MREASIPGLLLVLLAIATLSTDAGPVAVPTAATLLVLGVAFHLLVVLPSLRVRSTARVAVSLAVAAPFGWALELTSPSGLAWPLAPLAIVTLGSILASRAGTRVRTGIAAVFAVAFVTAPLVEGLSLGEVPRALRLPTAALEAPLPPPNRRPPEPRDAVAVAALVRAGALVPAEAAALLGVGHRVVDAPWTNAPAGVTGGVPAGGIAVRVVGAAVGRRADGRFVLVSSPDVPRDARDLDACDVVLLLEALGRDASAARTLESFVRRGGLLAGPPAPASFGADLERALGTALPDDDGPRGVRTLGAGHVARVARVGGLEELAADGFVEPRFATAFDRAVAVPPSLREAGESGGAPSSRVSGTTLALLAGFAAAVGLASRLPAVRGAVAATLLSAAALLGLGLVAPTREAATAEGFVLDLGGPRGRRVEALRVTAGPAGWRWTEPARTADAVRVLGFTSTGGSGGAELNLEAGRVGWIVTESAARGESEGLAPIATVPEWSIPLLRRGAGRPADARLFVGETAFRGLVPGTVRRPTSARMLTVIPGRP